MLRKNLCSIFIALGLILGLNSKVRAQSITSVKTPSLMLAYQWEEDVDLTGWLMSEKLDGVRAYWNGKELLSRQGNVFNTPKWFIKDFPDEALDGELWIGRQKFSEITSVVRKKLPGNGWKKIIYYVFDAPLANGGYEDRLQFLNQLIRKTSSQYIKIVKQQISRGNEHVKETLKQIESLGGEGLIVRKPGSKYHFGRSNDMLKVKTFHDMEAVVIGHIPGSGRNTGRLGSLLVELFDGTRFAMGSGFSDKDRKDPPPIGSIITFKYTGFTKSGIPRFASFLRIREDF